MEEGEMDFHGMKRKQLQALCKKHGILANKSNAEMADLLTLTLKANENPITEGHGELPNKNDSMNVPKKSKKVRFSPDVETREYEPSVYKRKKRRSMVNSEKVNGSPPRARSRVRRTVERNAEEVVLPVVGKKRGSGGEKKGSLGVENVDATLVTKDGGPQLVMGGDKLRRHLRSREVVIERNVEGGAGDLVASRKNSKRGMSRKRGNSEGSNGNALLDEVSVENVSAKDDAKPAKKVRFSPDVETREYEPSVYKGKKRSMVNSETVNGSPPRARSRERRTVEKKVDEVVLPVVGKKRGSRGEKKGSLGVENVVSTLVTEDGGPQLVKGGDKLRRQLRGRQVLIGRNVEGGEGDLVASRKNSKRGISRKRGNNEGSNGNALLDEVSVENVSAKDDAKPANIPLRPRRNARKNETTSLLTVELGETEFVGRTTRSRAKSENNTSSVTENKAETFEVQDECQKVLQIEESLKGVGSYALRRKSFVPQKGVAEEILTEEGVEARKGDGRSRRNARKKEGAALLSGDFGKTEIVGRITRSRCSTLGENTSSVTTNKSETIEIQDEREKVLQLEEPSKGLGRSTLRRKSMVPQKGVAVESVSGEGLESIKDVRPSKRNTVKATDSKPIIEVVVSRRTRFGAQVAGNNCAVESADEDTKDNKEQNRAVQLEESLKAQSRNVSRQKSVTAQNGKVESEGPDVNSEIRKLSRNAVLKAVNEVEASVQPRGKPEKALVPIGHLRRSRRNTVLSSSTFATDELGIVEAAGKVGQQKQKRNPMLGEDASPVAGKCLVDTPSRQAAQHASKSDLVGSTVPGKIVEKKQQSISALPVIVQAAMFTEETQIEHTRLTLSEVTGDKVNFSLNCGEEVSKTYDKRSDSKPSEMRRTSFSEVSAVFSDFQEGGVDPETNLQETSSPTSTSTSLTLLSASANQEMPENASQPAVINDEADIVVSDKEKLVADVIPDVGADDLSCRSTEGGADFVNGNSDELGVAELQTNASDTLSLASGFSSANKSDFSGLEKGLERKELGEDIHLESGDANDGLTEIDRTSALDDGVCDLEKAGLNVTIKRKEHEEAPCDDRASPAAGEGMVSLSSEINLLEDGDVLLTQAAEEEQNFISERNSGYVSRVSGVCDLEKAGLDVTTNTNEHEEAPCVDRASLSAGEGMVSLSSEIDLQEDGEVLYTQAAEEKQNFISERNSANVSQVSGGACTHDLLDGEGTCLSAPEEGTNGSENGSAATVPLQFTVIGKRRLSFSAGDSSLDRNIRHHDEKACEDEKHVLNLEKKEATADAQPQSSLKELQDKEKDSFAVTPDNCIAEVTGETEVTIRGDSGKPSTRVNSLLMLSEEFSGYKEMIEKRNCRLDATIDVPISKFHGAAMDMVSGRNMDRESDVEKFETKEEESGCAVTTEHGDDSGSQKVSTKVDANVDSGFTHIISEEREGSEGKTVDMMGHSNDFHISSIEMVSDKNMTRNPCDHVVGKETAKGALLFEHCDHRGSEEVAANLNGIADASLTPTIEKCENKEEESGCAVTTEHGDDSGSQKVSAKVDANADSGFTHVISEEREGSEGKTVDMMGHSNDFHISSKEMVSGKKMTRNLCDHVVGKETAKGALLFELCDHRSSKEVAANLNGIADGSLTPTIENCETKEEESGCAVTTEHGDDSGSQKVSAKVDANADSGFTHIISEEREGSEGKTVDMMDHSNDFHISSKEMVSGKNMTRDLCDHVVGKETAKGALLFELCDHRSSEEVATNLNGIADASLNPNIYKEIEISRGKNVGWGENSSNSRKRTNMWTDQETVSVGDDSNADTASADIEDRDDTSDGVMDAELELGVEAGKFDNLEELNALERERSASIAIENRNSMDVIAAFTKENVVKLEDDLKLKHCNIDDEKEYSIVALPQVTPKGMTEHSVEEELHEINEGCEVVPNDSSKKIEVEADEARSVAIGGKICFVKVEDCNNWTERTAISPRILESSRKKAKQTSSEQKLLAGLSSGTFRMGSSTDAVSELNVLLSHGEKYKSHPISNEAGGKAMAASDKGSDASAFTDWEVNLIQGNREQDQFLFTDWEANSIQESDGEGLIDNLISNNSEHAARVEKNVEEVLFTDREMNLIQGSGEQDQAEESDEVASRDNLKSNDPLDEHAADDAIRDLKADDISYPDIQETCETGLGAIDNVGIAAAEKMDILEEVGIRGTSQPVIPAEASLETAKGTLQKAFLSCSKPDESTSSEQLVFDGTSCGLPETISVGSVVRENGPVAYEGGFVPQLYSNDMHSHGGGETTCDHRGSNPPEQGEFHQTDYEVLIAHTVGAEEAREPLNDATGDTSLESNPTDPQEVAIKDANEPPDAGNEPALMVGLDCVPQNQQSCQCEREEHPIGTEAAAHCLHKLDDGVFSEEIVDFGNGLVTSLINYQRDVDSSAGSSVSASQHHITENDPWELNLFFGENEQYENQTSDGWFLNSNLRNKDARMVEANIVGTEQAAIQVGEEQHGQLAQVMDEQIEEAKHTFFAVSDEPLFEDAEASKKQDCVPLEVDSIQDCINCENYENKSGNTEHSDSPAEKEILIDVAEFNACHNAVSSEQRVERNPSYSKQHNNGNLSVEDAGITTDLSVDVPSKPDVDILDQSFAITNSAVGQDIAVGDDETRQLKLPLPQKTTSYAKEEESHSSDAKRLNTSLLKRKISKTGFVQATPQKMVTCTDMKENLTSNKGEQHGHMTAPNAISKRRALENLRNN
ncbi:unnamed protein product [Dovyalis caffra]|uniref:SAP domain-containing protein n=1 Tax=Dovyalis caffra TaxID=77055 RepID=A0AAV1SA21_9ROSI|nr:unnamed protein product [Dovyalis caffra]